MIEEGCDYQKKFNLYFCTYALTHLWQNNDADCNIIGGIWGEIYIGYPIWF
jgi:hypothetical protein